MSCVAQLDDTDAGCIYKGRLCDLNIKAHFSLKPPPPPPPKKPLSQSTMNFKALATLTALAATPVVTAGPLAYALCQTGMLPVRHCP